MDVQGGKWNQGSFVVHFSTLSTKRVNEESWRVNWLSSVLCMYVPPSDQAPDKRGHIVLSVLVQEFPPPYDSHLKWQGNALRFSHFQCTAFRIDQGPVINISMGWACDHLGACGFMITGITADSTAAGRYHIPSLSYPQEHGSHPHKPTFEWVSFTG